MALNYASIRRSELLNTLRVDFYKDGKRYYAFDHSAWFVCVWLSPGEGLLGENGEPEERQEQRI